MPGDFLDLILLALVAAFAVAGYRQGFIIGVLSLAGFIGGVAGGAIIAPAVARTFAHSTQWQAFIAILVVFSAAVIGMLLASAIGVAIRSRLTGRSATALDSLGGAVVNVISVLIVAWLIGSLVSNAPFPAVSRQVNDSIVLRTVDRLMPSSALYLPVFPPLRSLMNNGLYAPVFSALGTEATSHLPAPSKQALTPRALAKIDSSVVKIVGLAPGCSSKIEGSGFVISRGHVLTNAHVVAGVTQQLEVYTQDHSYSAQVVFYDPDTDIAVLDVPGLAAPTLRFAGPAPFDSDAAVAGYPENHGLTTVPARVGQAIEAEGPNIYEITTVRRQVYEIRANVLPGNSGGPLMAPDGRVFGVVFAASIMTSDTGYALTAAQVTADAQRGEAATAPVSTRGCQG